MQTLFWDLSNAQKWQEHSYDLTPWAGQTVSLQWGVYNDGMGGQTAMYVDDVSLPIAPPAGSTRVPFYMPLALK